ncbi:MAG: copper amine oxidase N-terminal domain-containing protein [Bacillaceae bacterium]|nr:copper amine oxidase N-terminal domain-containing protein [Bacillaceae bacterium]
MKKLISSLLLLSMLLMTTTAFADWSEVPGSDQSEGNEAEIIEIKDGGQLFDPENAKPPEKADPNMVDIEVDGYLVPFPDAYPYIDENNRTLIPVRFVSEALGAKVDWVPETRTVLITHNDQQLSLTIGDKQIYFLNSDGQIIDSMEMDTAAIINEDRTFVPVRFVSEALGAKVEWDAQYRVVYVTTEGGSQ